MAEFVSLRKENSEVFIKRDTIARISFSKADTLPQSERIAKICFTDGTTGEYIAHRNLVNEFYESSVDKKAE